MTRVPVLLLHLLNKSQCFLLRRHRANRGDKSGLFLHDLPFPALQRHQKAILCIFSHCSSLSFFSKFSPQRSKTLPLLHRVPAAPILPSGRRQIFQFCEHSAGRLRLSEPVLRRVCAIVQPSAAQQNAENQRGRAECACSNALHTHSPTSSSTASSSPVGVTDSRRSFSMSPATWRPE